MRTPEQVKWDFVQQWLGKAQKDLRAATILLNGELEDFDPVGFHAQQAAEKFIKAVLVRHQLNFPKLTIWRGFGSSWLKWIGHSPTPWLLSMR